MAAYDWWLAWLDDEAEAFDPVAHKRRDLPVAGVEFTEAEATDATPVTVRRDAVGAATYAGKSWALLSYELPDGTVVPVQRMKLKKRPLGQQDGLSDLSFESLPSDWLMRRTTALTPLKFLPPFDPLLVDPTRLDDPVEILDGHQRVVHFDRVTGECTTPNILGVGLPLRTFTAEDIIGWEDGGGVRVTQTETPLAAVQIILTSEWIQRRFGEVDATDAIKQLFSGSAIETLDGDTLENSWFKEGSALNGASGYTVLKSRLTQISPPGDRPAKVGPVYGQKERYNYVADPNLQNPLSMSMDVSYYDVELRLYWEQNQKRIERVEILIVNLAPCAEEGETKTLTLKSQDVSLDSVTPLFVGGANYPAGSVIRSGSRNYRCLVGHIAKGNFGADQATIQNGKLVSLWAALQNDNSALGGSDRDTYYQTARGRQTIEAAILKAIRLLADSTRCIEVEFTVPFVDVVTMTTASAARIEVDDALVPGGWAEGKVVRIAVSDQDIAKAVITVAVCPASGEAAPAGTAGSIGYTDQPWDRVGLDSWAGRNPIPLDQVTCGTLALNGAEPQLAFIQANDYRRDVAGRNDKTINDPKHLVKQVKTNIVLLLTDVSSKEDLTNVIPISAGGWPGPFQISIPE